MTQRDLAQRINVGNTTLSQYESGARVPSDEVKIKIASVFGVSVDYLLGASSERNSAEKAPCSPAVAQRPVEAAIAGELSSLSDRQLDRLLGYIQALKELPEGAASQNTSIVEKNASSESSSAAG
jgi:transcriptional regulator with XRE-family HTH domain